jgi:hypothetical protein
MTFLFAAQLPGKPIGKWGTIPQVLLSANRTAGLPEHTT